MKCSSVVWLTLALACCARNSCSGSSSFAIETKRATIAIRADKKMRSIRKGHIVGKKGRERKWRIGGWDVMRDGVNGRIEYDWSRIDFARSR